MPRTYSTTKVSVPNLKTMRSPSWSWYAFAGKPPSVALRGTSRVTEPLARRKPTFASLGNTTVAVFPRLVATANESAGRLPSTVKSAFLFVRGPTMMGWSL
ncbi:MAG: hypothetical protein HC923_05315 [Myxococcales bacterium]|nr:hypothetical protein [Myxococcales bacterium]